MPTAAATEVDLMKTVKELYDFPEKFVETALNCNTAGIDARIHDWFKKYPFGIFVTEIKFSAEYIKSNPTECFVKAMITDASMSEGRGRDVFKGVPQPKREALIREKLMPEYIIPKELRLSEPDKKEFLAMFSDYVSKNGIQQDKREKGFCRKLSSELQKAEIIELGGLDEKDHLYYATSGDMVYIINFGEWKKLSAEK